MRRTRPAPPALVQLSERDRLDEWVQGLPVFHGTYLSAGTPLSTARLHPRTTIKLVERRAAGLDDLAPTPLMSPVERVGWVILATLSSAAWVLAARLWLAPVPLFALVLVAAVRLVWLTQHRPLWLSPRERRDVERARVWRSDRWKIGHWPDEFRLVEAGAVLVTRISRSAAWRSAYLDEHRLRLDLWSELDTLDLHAWQLYCAGRDLGTAPHDHEVRALWHRQRALLDIARQTLLDRLLGLKRYADRLAEVDRQLADLAALQQMDRTVTRVNDLLTQVARDRLATDALDDLTDELAVIQRQVANLLSLLQGDYLALVAVAR